MKFKISIIEWIAIIAFVLSHHNSLAQSYADSLAQDDHDILSSIAAYDEETRLAILNVSQYPQTIVKLERIQARSSQSFQDLIGDYSREEQEKLYDFSRFPDVINKITSNGKMKEDEVRNLLMDYPEATRTRMLQTYQSHFDDLVKMNSIYISSQEGLQKIIANYPPNVQQDFEKVVAMPEVIHLLTENIDLNVSLGQEYRVNPTGVRNDLDSLSRELSRKNTQDLAAYKTEVENDPKLQTDMRKAADDFSAAYDQPDNPNYVANNYYDNFPYPYWFSYPYWYSTPIWYPRPFYYHTGFYYGAGGNLVVVGLPSRMYSTWFYTRGYRNYPYLYNHYNTYHNFHRHNVYRGFNNTVYNRNRLNTASGNRSQDNSIRSSMPARTYNSIGNRNVWKSQMNLHPNHFNTRGIQRFHANTYHSMGWQNVGRSRSGGGQHSGGGRGRGRD